MDWFAWHVDYDTPDSALARRLRIVQDRIHDALDRCPPGPVSVVSLCAGQGRDLLEVLHEHPRSADVRARLVELDLRNASVAEAASAALPDVEIVVGDAARADQYAEHVPADLVLLCGIFGHVSDSDVARTIAFCRQLCATGGTVVWTRQRRRPDLVPQICAWFRDAGFDQMWRSDPKDDFGVGAHRFVGATEPLLAGQRIFEFVDGDPA